MTACELVRNALGRDSFNQELRDRFLTPRYIHAPIHEHIFRLDSRIVATPHFDNIYETYANHAASGSIITKHYYDPDIADAIREDGRLLLKIHGSIDSPNRLIFTRSEYAKAPSAYHSFYNLVDALATTHTFLFLGCGVNDPDLALLLEDAFFRHQSARQHIMILPKGSLHDDEIQVLRDVMNLIVLQYSGINNHAELVMSLEELAVQVEFDRDKIRQTGNW